jgi:transcriptional regulator with XRE-family HTH domain
VGTPETFKGRFNRLFEGLNKSQNAFAKDIGLSQSQVSNYLEGNNTPSLDNLDRIATYFGISVAELLLPAEPPAPRIVTPSPLEALEIVRKALQAPGLSKDEEDILAAYRALTPDGKRSLLKTAVAMPKAPAAKKSDRETG